MSIDNPADRTMLLLLAALSLRGRSRRFERARLDDIIDRLSENLRRQAREYYQPDFDGPPGSYLVEELLQFMQQDRYSSGFGFGSDTFEIAEKLEALESRAHLFERRLDALDERFGEGSYWHSREYFEGELESLGEDVEALKVRADVADIGILQAKDSAAAAGWSASLIGKLSTSRLRRRVPVQIFSKRRLSEHEKENLQSAILDVLALLDIELDIDLPGQESSWRKKFWTRTKEIASSKEVEERLKKLEQALVSRHVDKPMAEVTQIHSDSVAKLIKALDGLDDGCLQVGNVLVVKRSSLVAGQKSAGVAVKTLSALEMHALESNQALLDDPHTIVKALQDACGRSANTGEVLPRRPSKASKFDDTEN